MTGLQMSAVPESFSGLALGDDFGIAVDANRLGC